MAGAQGGAALPVLCAAAQRLRQEPAVEWVAMETLQQRCQPESQKPYPISRATSELLGLQGAAMGGPARSPRLPSRCMASSA